LGIRDVYKLLHQGIFGVGHIMGENAEKWLHIEFSRIRASDVDPLTELISIDGNAVRVNLRAYKARWGSVDALYEAMTRSIDRFESSRKRFEALWSAFVSLVSEGALSYDNDELKSFDDSVRSDGFTAQHHTREYRASNRPAYRVLDRQTWEGLRKSLYRERRP
jgi:hypothetical protein